MVLGIGGVVSAVTALVYDRGARDDDTVNMLNHMVMSGLLICLAVASGSRQYVGSAIYCWSPAEFSKKYHRRYLNHYCWVNAVYSIPFDEPVPAVEESRYFNDVSYYKLATALFLILAALFRIPHLLWKLLKRFSCDNLEEIVGLTTQTALMDQGQKEEQLGRVAELFHRWISSRSCQQAARTGSDGCLRQTLDYANFGGNRSGHRLVFIFLLIKWLYLFNVVGQFFIVSAFLRMNFWKLGLTAAASYFKHGQWEDSYNFPRVAHCDFKIRQMNNVHTYTVQCALAINAFLEKMFLLVWVCLMLLMIANAVSCIRWMCELLHSARTVRFLRKYFGRLVAERSATYKDRKKDMANLRRYLQADGVFVIRMVAVNTSGMLTCDLVKQIWTRYSRSMELEAAEEGGVR